jgi:DNA-binding LacI/PurR family transcriptional regulator
VKFEAATIKDIAKVLGYSPSTVSRALRDSGEISETTKQIVMDYARKIDFIPNPIALSLKVRKSKTIGVVVPGISNAFFSQVINGIECIDREHGYQITVTQSQERYDTEVMVTKLLASRCIDGCLVSVSSETTDSAHFNTLRERGLPIVFFDRVMEDVPGHQVSIDNQLGAYKGTMHLLKNGCRRIAFLGNSPTLRMTAQRRDGYLKALAELNIEPDPGLIGYCEHDGMDIREANEALQYIFNRDDPPDAIFSSTDELTMSCMRWCRTQKIDIPGDIALAGFSNIDNTDFFCPSLTVIRQPATQMGRVSARLLLRMIESKRPLEHEHQILPVELKVGESSRGKMSISNEQAALVAQSDLASQSALLAKVSPSGVFHSR